MSASEKLKALETPPEVSLIAFPKQVIALRRALPQIVAVVEAAEDEHPEPHHYAQFGEGGEVTRWECPVCDALAALEEALS